MKEKQTKEDALKDALTRANKSLELEILAGGVAHDLNNVLSGLVSGPEAVLRDLPEDSSLKAHVQTIKESGKRALDIAEELLTMVRGSAMVFLPVQLNNIIEDYFLSPEFDMVNNRFPDVKIVKDLDSELPLMNTGQGICSQDIDHIFEPFYSKKVLGKSGTGLGLTIVWNAVHDHNGYIHASSRNSKTYFTLYFPISERTQETALLSSQVYTLEDYSGNGETILVVDDRNEQQIIAANMLKRLGYEACVVSSGEAAGCGQFCKKTVLPGKSGS